MGGDRCISQFALDAEKATASDQAVCNGKKNATNDAIIAACTRLIASGRIVGRDLAVSHFNRGNQWYQKHDFDRAIVDFTSAFSADHDFIEALLLRGVAWARKKDLDRALTDLNRYISLDPINSIAHIEAADLWLGKGDFDAALREANEAIQYDKNNPYAYARRGQIKLAKADFDGAITDLTRCITLKPNLPEPYGFRGRAFEKKGEYQKALVNYKMAISLSKYQNPRFTVGEDGVDLARRRIPELDAELRYPILAILDRIGLTRSRRPITGAGFAVVLLAATGFFFFRRHIASGRKLESSRAVAAKRAPTPNASEPDSIIMSQGITPTANITPRRHTSANLSSLPQAFKSLSEQNVFGASKNGNARLGKQLIAVGIIGLCASLVWWFTFYSQVQEGLHIKESIVGALPCLYQLSGMCGFIVGLTSAGGFWPYHPMYFWISAIVLIAGVIIYKRGGIKKS